MEFIKTDAREFNRQLSFSKRLEFFTIYPEATLDTWELYVSIDSGVGFALTPEGEIVNVFNNTGVKLCGREAIQYAISKGGKRVFCIGEFLRKYYEALNFEVTETILWDDALAPACWTDSKYGRPRLFILELKQVE
jgi:hypothetical protein